MTRAGEVHRKKRVVKARAALREFNESCHRPARTPAKVAPPKIVGAAVADPEPESNDSVVIARLLARVADVLSEKHSPNDVADFLLRCAFTSFLSSVDIIPALALTTAIQSDSLGMMWAAMAEVFALPTTGIFASMGTLPLDSETKTALIEADARYWARVDLSIFGGLVEGAFDAKQRHRLGAHYTPREYVMRLVAPTIEEPLRQELNAALEDKSSSSLLKFHEKLCATRVLDPACGSGNFLIVALETLHGIEDDVFRELGQRGVDLPEPRVSPHQMHGIEINQRACDVCKLVLNMCGLRRKHALAGASDGSGSG